MSIVILCSAQGVDGPLGHPILKREDIELSVFDELPRAFIELKSKRVDLLILEEGGSVEETLALVRRVGDVTANVDIKIICLWKTRTPCRPAGVSRSVPPLPASRGRVREGHNRGPRRRVQEGQARPAADGPFHPYGRAEFSVFHGGCKPDRFSRRMQSHTPVERHL